MSKTVDKINCNLSMTDRQVSLYKRENRWPAFALLFILALLTCGFGPPRLVDSEVAPTYSLSTEELRQWTNTRQMDEVSARAVIVYDLSADRVLLERNADLALPPASLTKLMTALLVFEENKLTSRAVVFGEDLIGDASMGLQAGESMSVENLLWGLLVPSGNDAAMTLARYTAGSVSAFVERMNRRAAELGMSHSQFANPHGLDSDGHLSSARDLLIVTRRLWQFPLFQQIVGTAETTIAGHPLRNTNELLGVDAAANGVKTGTTDLAGECLVAGFEQTGHQRFIIVLGSADRYTDVRNLVTTATDLFPRQTLSVNRLPVFSRLYMPDGSLHWLYTSGVPQAVLVTPFDTLRGVRHIQSFVPATWQPGNAVGEIRWNMGEKLVGTQMLILR